jgi:lipid II:glycine glycyltransferase (peptidoglycan interpeptide bridge formation enzyme)
MKKSEIKQGIQSIINVIKTARENIDDYLIPYKKTKELLNDLIKIEEEYGVDNGIDYETIEVDTLKRCIENSEEIQEIEIQFDYLITDLENWRDESSERKGEQIQEDYIDVINEIKDNCEFNSVECEQDLDDRLFDTINALEEIVI